MQVATAATMNSTFTKNCVMNPHMAQRVQNNRLLDHAGCMAAGTRDGWRTAHYYVRDLRRADAAGSAPLLSRVVAGTARTLDGTMSWSASRAVDLMLPSWRALPSPFAQDLLDNMAAGVRDRSIVLNPLFNAYFFRALNRVVEHFYEAPSLVLEHRVDAARRALSGSNEPAPDDTRMLARILLHLVAQKPVARAGAPKYLATSFAQGDINVATCAIACVALLLAKDGEPGVALDENAFFGITAGLLAPQLTAIEAAVNAGNEAALAQELEILRDLY
jgi:hypothetical protein